jgi:hypothetical protein
MRGIIPDKYIRVKQDEGDPVQVTVENYVKVKTRALKEFGYNNLTEDEVREQVGQVIHGGKLTVIGQFIKGDIVK